MAENNLGSTQYFRTKPDQELEVKEILDLVYNAMEEKGYNPINQIVGYIMSGDPTYITSYQNARVLIRKLERDELLEELRGQGVTDLKDVQYAVLETSGQVSVLLRPQAQPVTPRQLSLNVTEQLLPVLLINDGRLLRDNMKKMDVDDAWLRQQLKREHLTDPSQVFLLSLDQGGNVICQAKEDV